MYCHIHSLLACLFYFCDYLSGVGSDIDSDTLLGAICFFAHTLRLKKNSDLNKVQTLTSFFVLFVFGFAL